MSLLETNRKSTRTVRPELCRTKFDPQIFGDHPTFVVSATLRPTRTHAPTMGNSASPCLGSGSAHGSRDVRITNPETEERPSANPELNRKSKESNRTSHEQLPVPQIPYNINKRIILPETRVMTYILPLTAWIYVYEFSRNFL